MNNIDFSGLYPLFIQFNTGLYELFNHAPLYVGKLFVGTFYGIILGFIASFWKNEIIQNGILLSSSLWLLSFLNCITIEWSQIFFILGISGKKITILDIGNFLTTYLFEFIIAIIITIIFYITISKYNR